MHTTRLSDGWIAIHNSDFSGEIILRNISQHPKSGKEKILIEHEVPGSVILELVEDFLKQEMISKMEQFIASMKVVNAPIEILTKVELTWADVTNEFGVEVADTNCFDPLELPDGVRTVVSGRISSDESIRLSNVFTLKCRNITLPDDEQEVIGIIREDRNDILSLIAYKDKNGIIHFP